MLFTEIQNKYMAALDHEQKQHELFALGLHQMCIAGKKAAWWQEEVKFTFTPTVQEVYTIATEKYFFGKIIARYALGLKPGDLLPATDIKDGRMDDNSEFYALKYAKGLRCRQNLLRIITMKYLVADPTHRPDYELLMVWPSSWPDKAYLQFLIRFYERIKTMRTTAEGQCERFEKEAIPRGWFDVSVLGSHVYNFCFKSIVKNDPTFKDFASKKSISQQQREMVERTVRSKGLMGLYWQFRNREAHAFENKDTFTILGDLSVLFVNYWRGEFPLMLTSAYLIGINLDLHKEASFNEFYSAPSEKYDTFKNRSSSGFKLN